jgi:ubiquinone/menaquinone biosynthesis C-methylase UbiE
MADPYGDRLTPVQKAFSKQARHYDQDDSSNPILQEWRAKVYAHVNRFLKSGTSILELNAGTGIDALHFVNAGHTVLATDFSPGMVSEIKKKILLSASPDKFRVRQCSFEALTDCINEKFDHVFSNFGGLNCSADLPQVVSQLRGLLNDGAFITWVIMPPICPWEIAGMLRGRKNAFRRLTQGGATAILEGEQFQTYYYSLASLTKIFGSDFHLVEAQGLGAVSPPPSAVSLAQNHPRLYSILRKIDAMVTGTFPFNRWSDHIIVTFQYRAAD